MQLTPIAHVKSPYKQKFAIPRQPNLVKQAVGEIVFEPAFADPNCFRGIEQFSHLWLVFAFHESQDQGWSPLVQPPRLEGQGKMGVFATRSPFRPNAIGLSVVEYLDWQSRGSDLTLRVGGIDLLNGTPILDIKPYIPYADAIPDAAGGFASVKPGTGFKVEFSGETAVQLEKLKPRYPVLREFICGVLMQDPRPVPCKKLPHKQYGMLLYDLNIKWRMEGNTILVLTIEESKGSE